LASNRPAAGQSAGPDHQPGADPAPPGRGSAADPPEHGRTVRWPRPSPVASGLAHPL